MACLNFIYGKVFFYCNLVPKESLHIQEWSTPKLFSYKKTYSNLCQNQWFLSSVVKAPKSICSLLESQCSEASSWEKTRFFSRASSWAPENSWTTVSVHKTFFGKPDTWKGLHSKRKEVETGEQILAGSSSFLSSLLSWLQYQEYNPALLEPVSVIVYANIHFSVSQTSHQDACFILAPEQD